MQSNLANSHQRLGRLEEALRRCKETYTLDIEVNGKEQEETLRAANNYASTLNVLKRFEEARVFTQNDSRGADVFSEKDIDSRSK